jgi:hypothetical protein
MPPRRSDEEIQREINDPNTSSTRRAYLRYRLMKRRMRNTFNRPTPLNNPELNRRFNAEFNPQESEEYIDLVPWRRETGNEYVYGSQDLGFESRNEEDHENFVPLSVTSDSLSDENININSQNIDFSCPNDWMKANCTSCKSPVSLDDFSIDETVLSFKLYDTKTNKFGKGQCIAKNELIDILKNGNSSIFSIWIGGDSSGKGGKPSNNIIVKLYIGLTTIYVTLHSAYKIFHNQNTIFYAVPLYGGKRRRIGNLAGRIGVSENHGQLPGFQVYKLFTKDEINNGSTADIENIDFNLQFLICEQMEKLVDMFQDTTTVRDFLLNNVLKHIID